MTDRNQQTHFERLAGNSLQTVHVSRPSHFLVQSSWPQIRLPPEGKWRTIIITVHNRMHYFLFLAASIYFWHVERQQHLNRNIWKGSLFSTVALRKLDGAKHVNEGASETLESVWIPFCLHTSAVGNRAHRTAWINKLACFYELNSRKVNSCGQIWHL